MRKLMTLAIAASGLTLASQASAAPTVLDFAGDICGTAGNQPCSTGGLIGQNYGDSVGVDVSYRSIDDVATGNTYYPALFTAGSYGDVTQSFGDLIDVVRGGNNAAFLYDEIVFTPTAGYEVSLKSFDAACNFNSPSCQNFIYSVTSGATAIAGGTSLLPAGGHSNFAVNSGYFTSSVRLLWQAGGTYTGLDNINFDVRAIAGPPNSAVPEPATWAMMLFGFGLVGSALRRRTRVTAIV
jgi:PEP-CTERM motif